LLVTDFNQNKVGSKEKRSPLLPLLLAGGGEGEGRSKQKDVLVGPAKSNR
jgi:hypothetical protein